MVWVQDWFGIQILFIIVDMIDKIKYIFFILKLTFIILKLIDIAV